MLCDGDGILKIFGGFDMWSCMISSYFSNYNFRREDMDFFGIFFVD